MLEGIPTILAFDPLLFPIAKRFGIHDVRYPMVVAISRVSPSACIWPLLGYIPALVTGTVIVAPVPSLSTGFIE